MTVVNHHASPRPGTGVLAGPERGRRGTPAPRRPPSARGSGARAAAPWLLPAIAVIGVMTVYPTVHGIWLSLTDRSLGGQQDAASFIGLANYAKLFGSPVFLNALRVTAVYSLGALALEMLIGLGLALLLNRDIRGRGLVRSVLISTMMLSPVVVGTVWRLLLNPAQGDFNALLSLLGLPEQAWLSSSSGVLPALIMVDVWHWTPLIMLILLAGLQAVPTDMYEAAQIDGANAWNTFRRITLPMLKPSIAIALLIRFMDVVRTFDVIYAMTGGGPGSASENLSVTAFYAGFQTYAIGYSSAISVVIFGITVLGSALIMLGFGLRMWSSR